MLSRTTLIVGVAAAAALASPALAGSSVDRATGGGQVIISSANGPGDTITFQARGTANEATGSVNVIDRFADVTTARGKGYHFKGTVTCLAVTGKTAKLAGTGTGPEGETGFTLLVVDNGEGNAAESDVISLTYRATNPGCGENNSDDDNNADLARGNAQVYDATP